MKTPPYDKPNVTMGKKYILAMMPYPSGFLHMGHVRVYTISDCISRHLRMHQEQVWHPICWDAFGLPAEMAAIKRKLSASTWTMQNIAHMRQQLLDLNIHFDNLLSNKSNTTDDDSNITTCHPSFYKWTQWIFQKLHAAGLAYRKEAEVNWDPIDQTVLANEQVDSMNRSWRSGAVVEKRLLTQWYLKITHYADRLAQDLDSYDQWPSTVKSMQRNWIHRPVSSEDSTSKEELVMRDWLISRQRKWGTPIPMIHCQRCGIVPYPNLPVTLEMQQSLDAVECPQCHQSDNVHRDPDTMDTFMDSSWYYMRLVDSNNTNLPIDPIKFQQWLPVDIYLGGIEHAILHLLYARFIHLFMAEQFGIQEMQLQIPFKRLITQGLVESRTFQDLETGRYLSLQEATDRILNLQSILKTANSASKRFTLSQIGSSEASSLLAQCKVADLGWQKMSKSKDNGVDPTPLIAKYGADTLRLLMLFKAPPSMAVRWNDKDITGPYRWIQRINSMCSQLMVTDQQSYIVLSNEILKNQVGNIIQKVDQLYYSVDKLNMILPCLMIFTKTISSIENTSDKRTCLIILALLLHPMAPNTSASMLAKLQYTGPIVYPSL